MSVPVANPMMMQAAASAPAGDVVTKSLRFNDGDNAYLSRTPSAGNRTTWTFSTWVKRAELGTRQIIFACRYGGDRFYLEFTSGNTIEVSQYGPYTLRLVTNAVYRDVGSWYHIVFKYDSTPSTPDSTSISLYVNGEQVTSFSTATYPSQDVTTSINAAALHTIGERADLGGSNYDGYLADIYFIDGVALTPTSFAEEDATTGQWKPKAYSGSYGTNGFHLEMKQTGTGTGSSSTIGADTSGEDNHFDTTNLAASDVVEDTPTDNYCVLNALDHSGGTTLVEGNLEYDTSGWNEIRGTIGVSSGKWYYEVYVDNFNTSSEAFSVGIAEVDGAITSDYWSNGSWSNSTNGRRYGVNLNSTTVSKVEGGSASTISASISDGDVVSILLDLDSGTTTLKFWVNGGSEQTLYSSLAAGTYAIGFNSYQASLILNTGQDPTFAGNKSGGATSEFYYAPPSSDFKALSTANLPTPTIAKPSEYFDTDLWTGDSSSTRNISTPFDPAFVWIKCRSNSGNGADHTLWDSLRGVSSSINTGLSSSHPEPEGFQNDITTTANYGGVSVLGTELYTLKNGASNARYVNETGRTYVGWSWRAGSTDTNEVYNADSGFSIVKWTGSDDDMSGDAQRVSHSLGVAPELILAKNRWNNGSPDNYNWQVYHKDIGASKYLILNSNAAEASYDTNNAIVPYSTTDVDFRDDMGMSDTIYMNQGSGMGSAETYVAYLFASVEGYSKVGSYTGNNSVDGSFVYTGFRPAFVLVKSISTSYSWYIFDSKREPSNVISDFMLADSDGAEQSYVTLDFNSNGFKFRTTGVGVNGPSTTDYIYYAVAESPFKYANAR